MKNFIELVIDSLSLGDIFYDSANCLTMGGTLFWKFSIGGYQ